MSRDRSIFAKSTINSSVNYGKVTEKSAVNSIVLYVFGYTQAKQLVRIS